MEHQIGARTLGEHLHQMLVALSAYGPVGVSSMLRVLYVFHFFFSSRRRHTRFDCDWSSDVCSSDLAAVSRGATPLGRLLGLRLVEEVELDVGVALGHAQGAAEGPVNSTEIPGGERS